jgi:hypothetical protein
MESSRCHNRESSSQTTRDQSHSLSVDAEEQAIYPWILITKAHINGDIFSITFDDEPVLSVPVIVCLGVAIDKLLTMAKHLHRLRERAGRCLSTLLYVAGQNVTKRSSIALMRSIVMSKLQFGREFGLHLASAAAVTMRQKLQQV